MIFSNYYIYIAVEKYNPQLTMERTKLHLTIWKNIDNINAKWLDRYSELRITY